MSEPEFNPDKELCFQDAWGFRHRFERSMILFICENGWKYTPGFHMTLRDLLLSGF